jgi:AcrR family transcriptional regulator
MSAEETRQRILEAAFREFAQHGMAGSRVDRIAKSAGCNKNLLYIYFGSKEELFATVLERRLSDAYAGLPFTAEDLPGMARRIFDYAQTEPDVYRLLAWATLEQATPMPPARQSEHDRKLPLIRAAQDAGAVAPGLDPALILMAVTVLATAWSRAFPFGATANAEDSLASETVREGIAEMVARIVRPDA